MKKNKSGKSGKLSFKQAVIQTFEVQNCFQNGLQAFGKYSSKIDLADQSKCAGSLDIDGCLAAQKKYPNDNRWDFAFDYDGKVYFVEVHSAYSNEVGTVLKKLQWLKDWLQQKAPEIDKLRANEPFYWIQSGKFAIPPTTSQYREAVQSSILPIPKLILPRP